MELIKTHPFLTLAPQIQSIASNMFKKYNLNYFQVLKVFNDGSFYCLCNQASWLEFVFKYMTTNNKPVVYSHLPDSYALTKNSYYFLWESNLPEEPIKIAREFNIANGLTFVERHADFYYLIAFAAPKNNHGIIDCYLNHITELTDFINYFKQEKTNLLQIGDNNRIYLSEQQKDVNLKNMLKNNIKRGKLFLNNAKDYVTMQEYNCLQELAAGKTYKQIGKRLNLSPRTVETYFIRIKNRLKLTTKTELIDTFFAIDV